MEMFYSLQGEGYHQGRAAYFIRLAGCDVGCVWCDVKESWDASKHPVLSIDEIVSSALAHPGRLAIITGGVCLSPKKFKAPLSESITAASELKVVIFNKHDFEWAETYAQQVPASCKLYLQPEWDKANEMMPSIIDYVKTHPKWELSAQLHKYIQVP